MKRRRKKTRKGFSNKKRLAVFGISLVVIIAAFFVIMGMGGLFDFPQVEEDMQLAPVDKETGKINALIVGLDKGESLTDTIMVASYDLDAGEVNILSVPRDTRMYIGNKYQKINAAHAITQGGKKKGINGSIEAVTRLTGIPINYYVEFSCGAFRDTIDALGGVDFEVPQNMNYDDPVQDLHIHLKKGFQHLDGDKAEQFVRFRRYPMGDIDRVAAQQSFLKALAEQKLNAAIIPKLPEIYKALQKNLNTNITFQDVTKYILNVSDLSVDNIHMYSVPGSANGTDYGSSYWIADMQQLASLVKDTFGYDAKNITIHSADGQSVSKDVKKSNTQKEDTQQEKEEKTKNTKSTSAPEVTAAPVKKPENTQAAAPAEKTKETAAPTEKPDSKPVDNATAAPVKKPDADEKSGGIKRPAANPTTEE